MKKIFCKNCKWYKDEWKMMGLTYQDCSHPDNVKVRLETNHKEEKVIGLQVKKAEVRNQNNNCKLYKKKWYKLQ